MNERKHERMSEPTPQSTASDLLNRGRAVGRIQTLARLPQLSWKTRGVTSVGTQVCPSCTDPADRHALWLLRGCHPGGAGASRDPSSSTQGSALAIPRPRPLSETGVARGPTMTRLRCPSLRWPTGARSGSGEGQRERCGDRGQGWEARKEEASDGHEMTFLSQHRPPRGTQQGAGPRPAVPKGPLQVWGTAHSQVAFHRCQPAAGAHQLPESLQLQPLPASSRWGPASPPSPSAGKELSPQNL